MDYTITAHPSEHWVTYKVYEVAGWVDASKSEALYGPDFSTNVEHGHLIVQGDVKWDGCSNWEFNTEVMLHGCSRDDLVAVGKALAECWDMTASLCPRWNP